MSSQRGEFDSKEGYYAMRGPSVTTDLHRLAGVVYQYIPGRCIKHVSQRLGSHDSSYYIERCEIFTVAGTSQRMSSFQRREMFCSNALNPAVKKKKCLIVLFAPWTATRTRVAENKQGTNQVERQRGKPKMAKKTLRRNTNPSAPPDGSIHD